jgi:hypothetical protein
MMVGGRSNRKGLESQDVCCRRDADDGGLQKINIAARLGEASEMPCRLLARNGPAWSGDRCPVTGIKRSWTVGASKMCR